MPDDIPVAGSTWDRISRFALTYDGYERQGKDECAEIANSRRAETLSDLRTCLFFEQRRWHHFGEDPDELAMDYIRDLIEQIRRGVHSGNLA